MGKKDQYNFGGADEEPDAGDSGASLNASAADGRSSSQARTAGAEVDSTPDSSGSSSSSVASSDGSTQNVSGSGSELDLDSLPLKLRRNDVKDFRDSLTIQVQPDTERAIEQAQRRLSDEYRDERVYKLDAYEIIVLNGIFDEEGEIDIDGLKHQAELMGYGLDL